jgi:hypothetical protein
MFTYENMYPYATIKDIAQFSKDVISFSNDSQDQSLTIESSASHCEFCQATGPKWFQFKMPAKDTILYDTTQIERCRLNLKQCTQCSSYHYISYAIDEKTKVKKFYRNVLENGLYFQYSNETIMSHRLLHQLLSDILFKHCSFRAFADSYNFLYGNQLFERAKLNQKRLTEIFYCYESCKFHADYATQLNNKQFTSKYNNVI